MKFEGQFCVKAEKQKVDSKDRPYLEYRQTFSEKKRTPLSGKPASYVSPNNGLKGLQILPSVEEYPDTANAATLRILIRLFPCKFLMEKL